MKVDEKSNEIATAIYQKGDDSRPVSLKLKPGAGAVPARSSELWARMMIGTCECGRDRRAVFGALPSCSRYGGSSPHVGVSVIGATPESSPDQPASLICVAGSSKNEAFVLRQSDLCVFVDESS